MDRMVSFANRTRLVDSIFIVKRATHPAVQPTGQPAGQLALELPQSNAANDDRMELPFLQLGFAGKRPVMFSFCRTNVIEFDVLHCEVCVASSCGSTVDDVIRLNFSL
jgi:hypothetical protein